MSILGIHSNQDSQHLADSQNAAATGYRNNAASGYNQLGTEGANNVNLFASNAPNLLNQYEQTAGISNGGNGPAANPYALTPDQQTILNGQVDSMNKSQNTAIQQLRASLAAKGINDPRYIANAEANIRNGYAGTIAQHQAAFGEQARTDKQNAIGQLQQYLAGINGQGTGAQEAAAGGTANLAGQTQTASNQAQTQQNQSDANFNNSLGGLTNLAGFATGGGFGGNPFASMFGGGKGATSGSGSGSALGGYNADSNPLTGGSYSNPFASATNTFAPMGSTPTTAPQFPNMFGY